MITVRQASPYVLAGLLVAAGTTHFVAPGFYDDIVPHALPGSARSWTYASGVVELGVGAAVAVPQTRSRGALLAVLLFVAVFPANIQMAVDADTVTEKVISYARLPLQIPLVVWAWQVYRLARNAAETKSESSTKSTSSSRLT